MAVKGAGTSATLFSGAAAGGFEIVTGIAFGIMTSPVAGFLKTAADDFLTKGGASAIAGTFGFVAGLPEAAAVLEGFVLEDPVSVAAKTVGIKNGKRENENHSRHTRNSSWRLTGSRL